MRLSLPIEAKASIEKIQDRCKAFNPSIEPALSTFLFQLLGRLDQTLSKDQWEALASHLTSERMKRRRIRERLLKLGDKLDESDIAKFEQKLEKKRGASVSDSTSNQPKTADFSTNV